MEYQSFPTTYFGKRVSEATITPEELDRSLYPYKKRYLAKIIKSLPQNAVVLDAGCGNGKVVRMIRIYRPDVSIKAMDISDVGEYLPKGVEFKKGSVEEVDKMYPSEHFDAVFCLHVIEHLLYPMRMVEAFAKILKSGGKVFIETPNWTRLFIPFSHMFFWNDYTHVRPFTSFGIRKLFYEHGYIVDTVATVSSTKWFIKKNSQQKMTAAKVEVVKRNEAPYHHKNMFARIMARLLNPLTRDMLIVVAVKR